MALTGGFSGGAPICAKHGYAYLHGNRQRYLKACTAAFTLVAVNRATVTPCNAAHQREAQFGTAGRFTRPFQAIKRLEYARTFRLGHAGPRSHTAKVMILSLFARETSIAVASPP